jgi:biotin carboxylase
MSDCLINVKESVEEVKKSTINMCWRKLWHEFAKDRRICGVNDVVAEIVTIAPYKQIHKELQKKRNKHASKAIQSLQNKGLGTNEMLS